MRYALLLYVDPEMARRTTTDEAQAELAAYGAIAAELAETGVLVSGEAFMPAATAQIVTPARWRTTGLSGRRGRARAQWLLPR